MGKIMMNGKQFGVGGIQKAEDIAYEDTNVKVTLDELKNGLMHSITKTIEVNNEGTAVIFDDISKIPVLIANQTSGQYPLFLPYLYGNSVRARVINFSATTWLLVQNVTLTVTVYYINNPQ